MVSRIKRLYSERNIVFLCCVQRSRITLAGIRNRTFHALCNLLLPYCKKKLENGAKTEEFNTKNGAKIANRHWKNGAKSVWWEIKIQLINKNGEVNNGAHSDYHMEKGDVLSVGNIEMDGNVIYLPIYMCYLLKEQQLEKMIVNLDIDGL